MSTFGGDIFAVRESEGPTLYDTLGVAETATLDEIKAAYFQLVREYHPVDFPDKFQSFNDATKILTDDRRRKEYDQTRKAGKRVQVLVDQAATTAEKDPVKARELLRHAIVLAPDAPRPRQLLAQVLMRLNAYQDAEKQFRWLIHEFPDDEVLHYKLGRCLFLLKRSEDAEQELATAVRINSRYHDALMFLARLYERNGKDALAVYMLERAIENDGIEDYADSDALLRLFVIYVRIDNAEEIDRTRRRILDILQVSGARATQGVRRIHARAVDAFNRGYFLMASQLLSIAQAVRGVELTLVAELDQFAKRIRLVDEAKQVMSDTLNLPALRLAAEVLYVERHANDEEKKTRIELVAARTNQAIIDDPRQVIGSIEYLRREYPEIAADQVAFLEGLILRAYQRIERLGLNVPTTGISNAVATAPTTPPPPSWTPPSAPVSSGSMPTPPLFPLKGRKGGLFGKRRDE